MPRIGSTGVVWLWPCAQLGKTGLRKKLLTIKKTYLEFLQGVHQSTLQDRQSGNKKYFLKSVTGYTGQSILHNQNKALKAYQKLTCWISQFIPLSVPREEA